ncbi:DNA replication regulator SLD3-domain-containing protein [Xylaria nigripes]|nr:DNA replication regulator SLD3-domain-containing protein [Xylaria nigripes]
MREEHSDALRRQRPSSTGADDPRFDRGKSKANAPKCSERSDSSRASSSAMEELLRPQIVIKPHPPKLTVKPRSLQPLMLLPQEHLRLSYLALSSPYGSFEPSPIFESNIRILDLESRMGNRPVVLIARLETNQTVYAIERQANTLYTLCHLGSWVDLEQLGQLATVSCTALIRKQPPIPVSDPIAPAPLTTPQISHTNKKRRLAIETIQSLVKRPARSRSFSLQSQLGGISRPSTPIQGANAPDSKNAVLQDASSSVTPAVTPAVTPSTVPQLDMIQDVDKFLDAPNAEGIFETIRNQYLEALYHSMGSLAYFAKGPLSRARAAFQLDCDSTLEMRDLVEFLKSLVMTTVQIDKKFRDTIPKIQSEMKNAIQDSDVEGGDAKSKSRKRKSKKMKLGKDGLYPNENAHVRKWWATHKPSFKDDESATKSTEQQGSKLQISLLRSRETQLQMIIILEILALEPLVARENVNASQLPGLPPTEEPLESPKEIPTKKRNKHNLPLLLDVHADRLCIWQSTALDELNTIDESQAGSRQELQKPFTSTSDPLGDFCIDIIMPFFAARLPEQCDSINRKLGGPLMLPPPKSKDERTTPPSKTKLRPGAVTKRPAHTKPSETLEKFLSKETERNRRSISRGPSGAIALMRSATTSTIPLLKRETSDLLSLTDIQKATTSKSQEKKLPSADSSLAKRKAETKEKRDAFVKAELQDAISSLRRPNRGVVGKAMAEADERRATKSLSQLRKSKKPTQYHKAPGIVKATPVGARFRDISAKGHESQTALREGFSAIAEEPTLPSSSIVPSSAPRKRNREVAFASGPERQPTLRASTPERIITTPAKPSTLDPNFLSAPQTDERIVLASSPLMPRKISQPNFLNKARSTTFGHQDGSIEMPPSPNVLAETPLKSRPSQVITSMTHYVTVTPAKTRIPDNGDTYTTPINRPGMNDAGHHNEINPKKKMTIFERLGWTDDYDDLA